MKVFLYTIFQNSLIVNINPTIKYQHQQYFLVIISNHQTTNNFKTDVSRYSYIT